MAHNSIYLLNFILYLALVIFVTKKNAGKLGVLIVVTYMIVALGAYVFSVNGELKTSSTFYLWPFLYFFLLFVIMVYPLCKKGGLTLEKIKINNTKPLNVICSFYIIVSILYIYAFSGDVIAAIKSGQWLDIYKQFRVEEVSFYNSFYERVLINIVTYLRIPVLIYSFVALSKGIPYKYLWLSLILPIIDAVLWAIYTASRTEFVMILFLYLGCYLICYKHLADSIKRKLRIGFVSIAAISAVFLIAISFSRFGEGESYWLSSYFGDSFRVAHNMMVFTSESSKGSNFFHEVYNWFGLPITDYKCAVDEGSAFYTLIGMRFTDFGFFGTILYSLICCIVFCSIINKKQLSIGDVYLILYYGLALFTGVFYDCTTAFSWIIVLVVSLFLSFLSNQKNQIKSHKYVKI